MFGVCFPEDGLIARAVRCPTCPNARLRICLKVNSVSSSPTASNMSTRWTRQALNESSSRLIPMLIRLKQLSQDDALVLVTKGDGIRGLSPNFVIGSQLGPVIDHLSPLTSFPYFFPFLNQTHSGRVLDCEAVPNTPPQSLPQCDCRWREPLSSPFCN